MEERNVLAEAPVNQVPKLSPQAENLWLTRGYSRTVAQLLGTAGVIQVMNSLGPREKVLFVDLISAEVVAVDRPEGTEQRKAHRELVGYMGEVVSARQQETRGAFEFKQDRPYVMEPFSISALEELDDLFSRLETAAKRLVPTQEPQQIEKPPEDLQPTGDLLLSPSEG